jgi:hypothetical protein
MMITPVVDKLKNRVKKMAKKTWQATGNSATGPAG